MRLGDRALEKLSILDPAIATYMVQFKQLYPKCVKNKMHTTGHIATCMRRFGKNLNCFGPERRHRCSKVFAAYIFNNLEKALLARELKDFFAGIADPRVFEEIRLGPLVSARNPVVRTLATASVVVDASASMSMRIGTLSRNDIVLWRDGRTLGAGQVVLCLRFPMDEWSSEHHAVLVKRLPPVQGSIFLNRSDAYIIVNACMLLKSPLCQDDGKYIRILLPTIL